MREPLKDLVPCSFCHEGFQVNPNTGNQLSCVICKGAGFVTPHNICYCGCSCNTTIEGFNTCGDPKCLEGFKRDAASFSPNVRYESWETVRQNAYTN